MNYTISVPNLARPIGYGRSLQLLSDNDADRLKAFYLGLDFDNRRRRFGGGMSDQSIAQYCRAVDWQQTFIIARGSTRHLDAVLEIHPLSQERGHAEIVMTCPLDCDRSRIFAELLQLGAFTAGGQGCSGFVMYLDAGYSEAMDILGDIGRTSCDGEVLSADIVDYTTQ